MGVSRAIWNAKIDENEYFYSFGSKFVPVTQWRSSKENKHPEFGFVDQSYAHFKNRDLTPWMFEVPSQVMRNSATAWFQTQWKFFRGECGPPRRKTRGEGDSLRLTRELFRFEKDSFGNIKLWIGTKRFPIGFLNVKWHRKDFQPPHSICIKVNSYNRWRVSFSYDEGKGDDISLEEMQKIWIENLREKSEEKILPLIEGIDRGVVVPVATSKESFGPTEKEKLRMQEKDLRRKRWQRRLARQEKGSARREKTKKKIAQFFQDQANVRKDFAHKTTQALVHKTGAQIFVLENLSTQNMTRSARGSVSEPGKNVAAKSGLNREILSRGWHQIEVFLIYKALRAGKVVFKISPHLSSQECALCSHIHKDNRRSQSEFVCLSCGHQSNADTNAACVLKNRLAKMLSDSGTELVKGVLRLRSQDGKTQKSLKSEGPKDLTTRQKRKVGLCGLEANPALAGW